MEEDDLEMNVVSVVLSVVYCIWVIPFIVLLFFELWYTLSRDFIVFVFCSDSLKVFILYHAIFLGASLVCVLFYILKFIYLHIVVIPRDNIIYTVSDERTGDIFQNEPSGTDSSYDNEDGWYSKYCSPKKLLLYFISIFSAIFSIIGVTLINNTKTVCASTTYFNLVIIIVVIPVVLLLIYLVTNFIKNYMK